MPALTFHDLLDDPTFSEYIPYGDLLCTGEWRAKRSEILKRDNYGCTKCGLWSTETKFDSRNEPYFIWWGEDKHTKVRTEDGRTIEVLLPEIILAPKQYYLAVHHKFYIDRRVPWNYPNDALVTLCNWCHEDLHKNVAVEMYDENHEVIRGLTRCFRCNGAGWFPEYHHIQSGICFRCGGAKFEELIKFKNPSL